MAFIGLLPGGGGRSGAIAIVVGVAGRLPPDIMAIVGFLEGVGDGLAEPSIPMFGGEVARNDVGVLFCAEKSDGVKENVAAGCGFCF